MKNFIKLSIGLFVFVGSSCGKRNVDPIDNKYKEFVSNSIPVENSNDAEITQSYLIPGLISFNSQSEYVFTVGAQSEYKINVSVDDGITEIDLIKKDELTWIKLQKSLTEKNTWILSGMPPLDLLPKCQVELSLNIDFEIVVLKTPDKATAELLNGNVKTFQRSARIVSSKKVPLITCVSEKCETDNQQSLPLLVDAGRVKEFEIIVRDETANSTTPPELLTFYNSNSRSHESKEIAGSDYVQESDQQPKYIGDHKWLFKRIFDTTPNLIAEIYFNQKNKNIDFNSNSQVGASEIKTEILPIRFSLLAKSESCLYSPERQVNIEFHFSTKTNIEVKNEPK